MSLYDYWRMYDATLARIRDEKPDTFAALKAILDRFEPPSSGDAFFPGGADDTLAGALHSAGWELSFGDGDYVYTARHPKTGARLEYVEGDVYDRSLLGPGARIALVHTADPHTRLEPGAMGTIQFIDDAGTVHVLWDSGSTLGLIPGQDRWRPLHPRWDTQHWEQARPKSDSTLDTTTEDTGR